MKCPLRGSIDYEDDLIIRYHDMECLKEECAWWRDDINMCAIRDLSLEVGYTQHRLADIAKELTLIRPK